MRPPEAAPTVDYLELDGHSAELDAEAAIYVHFPFCRYICTYCDFDTFTGLDGLIDSYVDALVSQILQSPPVRATSLYVGGGTPSIMTSRQASRLIGACVERFGLPASAEATIEANPTDSETSGLAGFREAGCNRLSIGVQSTNPRLLRLLGRRHSAEQAGQTVQRAHEAGFDNVSVDLIYGVPMQDEATWRDTLETVADWSVSHLSCYMLTVEPGTPMERGVQKGILEVPADEETVGMYEAALEVLGSAGYRRYEISNWAQPGRESAHNLTYWRNLPYLGIGAGAAGFWNGTRYKVRPSVGAYIEGVQAGRIPLSESEVVDRRREMSETLILGLRLDEGVPVRGFYARFGSIPDEEFGEPIRWAKENGLLESGDGRLRLTGRGVLVSNELFERLL